MSPHDLAATILGSAVSLAGLLLVFVAFVYAKGESFGTTRGDKFKHTAQAGMLLVCFALVTAWFGLDVMQGANSLVGVVDVMFRATLVLTGLYGLVVLFVYL